MFDHCRSVGRHSMCDWRHSFATLEHELERLAYVTRDADRRTVVSN